MILNDRNPGSEMLSLLPVRNKQNKTMHTPYLYNPQFLP